MEYPWPGNVRELRNFCERLSVFCETEYAGKTDVMTALYSGGAYQRKKEKGTAVSISRNAAVFFRLYLQVSSASNNSSFSSLPFSLFFLPSHTAVPFSFIQAERTLLICPTSTGKRKRYTASFKPLY